jgi:hypothetical protein
MFFGKKRKKIKFKKLAEHNKSKPENTSQISEQNEKYLQNLIWTIHKQTTKEVPPILLGKSFPDLRVDTVIQFYFDDECSPNSELQSKSSFSQKPMNEKPSLPKDRR